MAKEIREIPVLFLRGDEELSRAIGINDTKTLKELRDNGLPYCIIGKHYVYNPNKVVKFIEKVYGKKSTSY